MEVPESLRKALDEVIKVAGTQSEVGEWARALQPLLEAATLELTSVSVTRTSRRGTGTIQYLVETTQQGDVLTEKRTGGRSKPFRCPRTVYNALIDVLGAAERPLAMDEINEAVGIRMGDRPPEHQVRVALRLWMHRAPPLLVRGRSRHRLAAPDRFRQDAHQLWQQLQNSSGN